MRVLLTIGGADPTIPDFFGCFPRDSARMRGYHSIVDLIDQHHAPTRVQYMGSMARGDPEVTKVAGAFIDSGIVSLTHGDYAKASVSFKVALAMFDQPFLQSERAKKSRTEKPFSYMKNSTTTVKTKLRRNNREKAPV